MCELDVSFMIVLACTDLPSGVLSCVACGGAAAGGGEGGGASGVGGGSSSSCSSCGNGSVNSSKACWLTPWVELGHHP